MCVYRLNKALVVSHYEKGSNHDLSSMNRKWKWELLTNQIQVQVVKICFKHKHCVLRAWNILEHGTFSSIKSVTLCQNASNIHRTGLIQR